MGMFKEACFYKKLYANKPERNAIFLVAAFYSSTFNYDKNKNPPSDLLKLIAAMYGTDILVCLNFKDSSTQDKELYLTKAERYASYLAWPLALVPHPIKNEHYKKKLEGPLQVIRKYNHNAKKIPPQDFEMIHSDLDQITQGLAGEPDALTSSFSQITACLSSKDTNGKQKELELRKIRAKECPDYNPNTSFKSLFLEYLYDKVMVSDPNKEEKNNEKNNTCTLL